MGARTLALLLGVLLALEIYLLLSRGDATHRWLSVPISSGRGTGVASLGPSASSTHHQAGKTPPSSVTSGSRRTPSSNGIRPLGGGAQPTSGGIHVGPGPAQGVHNEAGSQGVGTRRGRGDRTEAAPPGPRTPGGNSAHSRRAVGPTREGDKQTRASRRGGEHGDRGRHLGWRTHSSERSGKRRGHERHKHEGHKHEGHKHEGHKHQRAQSE
jgi:hypothetical protein